MRHNTRAPVLGTPWGEESIGLDLPGTRVCIRGLSRAQRETIARDYGLFVSVIDEHCDVICDARRSMALPSVPREQFVYNGQYRPILSRAGDALEILGVNSIARLSKSQHGITHAELAVASEDVFADFFVLENVLRILVAYRVLDAGGVLLHSAGFVHRDRAYLLAGHSNAGKTTFARKAASAGAAILSDDINLLSPAADGFSAHKVPFTGEFGRRAENLGGGGLFPLGGIAILSKASRLAVSGVGGAEAVGALLACSPFVNADADEFDALTSVLERLLSHVPLVRLAVARDDAFQTVVDTLLDGLGA